MQAFQHQRCLHHPEREAVARCPECGGFFCRECITEHEDRVICAQCLKGLVRVTGQSRMRFAGFSRAGYCALGVVIAWLFFYETGKILLLIPTSFHDGTLWHQADQADQAEPGPSK
jgi:hypothetical protein